MITIGPQIVTRNLIYAVDFIDYNSYIPNSTSSFDLVTGAIGGSHISATFNPVYGGSLISVSASNYFFTSSLIPLALNLTFTLDMWVKISNYGAGGAPAGFLCQYTPNYNLSLGGFLVLYNAGASLTSSDSIQVADQGSAGYTVNGYAANVVSNSQWHNWCVQIDRTVSAVSECSLYLDGVLQSIKSQIAISNNNNGFVTDRMYIGNVSGSGIGDLEIGSIKVYNTALSQAEVTKNFLAFKNRFGI